MPDREGGGIEVAGPYASARAKASHAQDGAQAPAGTLLPHLAGPAACLRQVLAAHAVRHCPHIVEIGGAGLPITGFLTHHPRSVTVIDPKIPAFAASTLNGAACEVRHLAAKLQALALRPPLPFALLLLGLSLKAFGRTEAVAPELLRLAAAAETLVVDYALDLERAGGQIDAITAVRTGPPLIDLAMTIDDPALREAGYARRRFLVYGRA